MTLNKVRYPVATAVVHALPCLQRTDMDAVGLVSRELRKEVEVSPVRRTSFLRLRCDELTGWECACFGTCQCEEGPGTGRISVEGTWTVLLEVFQHALRHSSASISFVELSFRDVHAALSGIAVVSSVVALEFYAIDFSGHTSDEFHHFVLASGQLESVLLDHRCTASRDYLTDSFLRECVAKGLVDVAFENIPTDAERYDLTDEGILDFISYDADKDGRRCLDVAAATVSQGFFKRLVKVSSGEHLDCRKLTEFCIQLYSVDYDQQDVGDFEGYAELDNDDLGELVKFRFHELPLFVSFHADANTMYASNKESDEGDCWSDRLLECIWGAMVLLGFCYLLSVLR